MLVTNKLLFLLIITDLMFMILDVLNLVKIIKNPLFFIGRDLGYAEFYQYMKEYWVIILLLIIAYKRKKFIYLSWSLIFLYVLLDDSLKLHETVGISITDYFEFQPMFGLRAKDFGELGVSIFFGTFLFSFLGIFYFYGKEEAKKISNHLLFLFFMLVFFGILVDMVGMMLHGYGGGLLTHIINRLFILIEDGGEMIVMSIMVWYLFSLKPTNEKITGIPVFKGLDLLRVKRNKLT